MPSAAERYVDDGHVTVMPELGYRIQSPGGGRRKQKRRPRIKAEAWIIEALI